MPRPAVTEPPAYKGGGICINVCKREREITDSVCIEKNACSKTRLLIHSMWGGGGGGACLQEKETENATHDYTRPHSCTVPESWVEASERSHTHTHTPGLLMYI